MFSIWFAYLRRKFGVPLGIPTFGLRECISNEHEYAFTILLGSLRNSSDTFVSTILNDFGVQLA